MTEQSAKISAFVQQLEDAGIREIASARVGQFIDDARQRLTGVPISGFISDSLLAATDIRMTAFLQQHGPSLIPEWKRLLTTLTVPAVYGRTNNG